MPRQTNIQIRRGTASGWSSVNPTLAQGEIAMETDTRKIKVGDGTTAWNTLQYVRFDGGDIGGDAGGTTTTAAPEPVGTLWAWGANGVGQLGDGTNTGRNNPAQIGSDIWEYISGGDQHTLAIKNDGTLWAWGENQLYGQLGLGDNSNRNSPVQVGSDTWEFVAASWWHSLGIKTNGTLWAWGGRDNFPLLGNGETSIYSSPIQIGSDTWKSVDGGRFHSLGVKTDGTLWAWGFNNAGQLGDGTTDTRTSPVQIGTETNWASVSVGSQAYSFALKTNGTLWAWGSNNGGNLGLGDTDDRNVPTQVGSDTWTKISAQTNNSPSHKSAFGVKTNGTLWAWGSNYYGELGDGTSTQRTSPFQIGSDTNWTDVSSGRLHCLALKNNGTLWSWGSGGSGQLGLGDNDPRNSPVQIGNSTWQRINSGGQFSLALKTIS